MFPAVTPFHFPVQDMPIPSHRLLSSDRITGQNASGEVTQKHRKKMKAKRRRWPNCQVVPASHPPAASFRLCPKCMGTHFLANPPLKVRLPARLISKEQTQPLLYLSTCSGCLRQQISKHGSSAIRPQPFCGTKHCSQETKAWLVFLSPLPPTTRGPLSPQQASFRNRDMALSLTHTPAAHSC